MDIANNVKKYKSVFTRLSKDKNNNLKEYLAQNNINIMKLLEDLGFNREAFAPFYLEIEKYALELLNNNSFPILSYPSIEGEEKHDYLTVYNSSQDFYIEIYPNKIIFIKTYQDTKNATQISCATFTTFIHQEEKIVKNTVEIIDIKEEDKLEQKICAQEQRTDLNGNLLNEGSYTINIKEPLLATVEAKINRLLYEDSIMPALYSLVNALEEGKIAREIIDLNLNVTDLQKK